MADAVVHGSSRVYLSVSTRGRPPPETRDGSRSGGRRTAGHERQQRRQCRGGGFPAPRCRGSAGHQRLERGCVRHDRRRRRKAERGSVHVVRVRAGCRLQRRRRHHPAVRALQLEQSWSAGGVASGGRRSRRARRAARVLPGVAGPAGPCAGGVPRRGSRRSAEGPGHPVRRARGRPAHRPPRGRRPQRADHVRHPACGRRLAPDPARVRVVLRPVDGTGGAAAARFAQPVPAGSASRVDLRHLHRGLQRGEGPWLVDQHGADARTDRDRAIHGASQLPAGQLLDARPGCPIPAGHQRQRTPVRGSRHERGRWPDRLLGRQIGIRLLAADHGDPAGRHRWQPGDGPGSPTGLPCCRLLPIPTTPAGSPRSWARPPAP